MPRPKEFLRKTFFLIKNQFQDMELDEQALRACSSEKQKKNLAGRKKGTRKIEEKKRNESKDINLKLPTKLCVKV